MNKKLAFYVETKPVTFVGYHALRPKFQSNLSKINKIIFATYRQILFQ
jgi:hypothetical protein